MLTRQKGQLAVVLAVLLILILKCGPPTTINVNQSNTAGPWDGSTAHPFKTIQDGLKAAKAGQGDIVEVYGGVYPENVTMSYGTVLRRAKGTTPVVVQGNAGSPTILAKDGCTVDNLEVEGGITGILIQLDTRQIDQEDLSTSITNCKVLSQYGIQMKTPKTLNFGKGVRRKPKVTVSGNWIIPSSDALGGTGIRFEMTGPKTGSLSIYLDISDNVIQQKFTGIDLEAEGQGENPDGFVRTQFIGLIANNLIFYGSNGIYLTGVNLGSVGPRVLNNTIVDNVMNAIVSKAVDGSARPGVCNNIIAMNGGCGFLESGESTHASDLNNNLFYKNGSGHYLDEDTGMTLYTQAELNTPVVNNKIIFISGANNLVCDPQFIKGNFYWNGINMGIEKASAYYLKQEEGIISKAVDAGMQTAVFSGLNSRTTSKSYILDTGLVDIGFHYEVPSTAP